MIRKYIFYTNDGFTQDLSRNEIENCQVLGWANGKNPNDAFENFKKENEFLNSRFNEILCQELFSEKVYNFLFQV